VTSAVSDPYSAEKRRLAAVSSMATVLAGCVDGLAQLRGDTTPRWLTELGVPPGWRIGQLADARIAPSRIAVCGEQPGGTFDGCETISVFAFSGHPPEDVVRNNADRTLRDLGATGITAQIVELSSSPDVIAARSSGYFAAAGLWMWAQYSFYVYGSSSPQRGRLIEQAVFVESGSLPRLTGGVAQLTRNLRDALGSISETG
jgi:hypothetical protein